MTSVPEILDVRPLLAAGQEPFRQIMDAVARLDSDQSLVLVVPFKPYPLFEVMAGLGYAHRVKNAGEGVWEVTFTPRRSSRVQFSQNAVDPGAWPDPSANMDLSDLPPGEAKDAFIEAFITQLPGSVVFALLADDPEELLVGLEAAGHQWVRSYDTPTDCYQVMVRSAKPESMPSRSIGSRK